MKCFPAVFLKEERALRRTTATDVQPRPNRKRCGVAMQPCSPTARTLGCLLTNDGWCRHYGRPFVQALQKLYDYNRSRVGRSRDRARVIVCSWQWSGVKFFFVLPQDSLKRAALTCLPSLMEFAATKWTQWTFMHQTLFNWTKEADVSLLFFQVHCNSWIAVYAEDDIVLILVYGL